MFLGTAAVTCKDPDKLCRSSAPLNKTQPDRNGNTSLCCMWSWLHVQEVTELWLNTVIFWIRAIWDVTGFNFWVKTLKESWLVLANLIFNTFGLELTPLNEDEHKHARNTTNTSPIVGLALICCLSFLTLFTFWCQIWLKSPLNLKFLWLHISTSEFTVWNCLGSFYLLWSPCQCGTWFVARFESVLNNAETEEQYMVEIYLFILRLYSQCYDLYFKATCCLNVHSNGWQAALEESCECSITVVSPFSVCFSAWSPWVQQCSSSENSASSFHSVIYFVYPLLFLIKN